MTGFNIVSSKIPPQGCTKTADHVVLKMRKQREPCISHFLSSFKQAGSLQGFLQHSMATEAIWLCCTFCSALLCGRFSCTFVSQHFQYLPHRQADWMAPCTSDLLSCLGMSNRVWYDKMVLQKPLHSPKAARVCDTLTGMGSVSVKRRNPTDITGVAPHIPWQGTDRPDSRIPWRTSSVSDNWKVKTPSSFLDDFSCLSWFVWFLFLLSYLLQPSLLVIGF